jgi:hypothetical protein
MEALVSILSVIKAALHLPPGDGEGVSGVHCIPAAENPFGVDVWDCRPFTHNRLSTTGSAAIARRYVELRRSQGNEMEDKWDIYLFDEWLYFVRSWTGELAFTAQIHYDLGALHLTTLAVADNQDPAFAPRIVDYLAKSHVLQHDALHPLPSHLPTTARDIAVFSLALFGRRCAFGTYADTIAMPSAPSS